MSLVSTPVSAHDPAPGLWFSPEHSGHGFDLQKFGELYIIIFYTYSDDNQPVWYFSVATKTDEKLSGTFGLFEYQPGQEPPQQLLREPGNFTIDFNNTAQESACSDAAYSTSDIQLALFSWSVDGAEGKWCVTPLLPQDQSFQYSVT